MAVTPNLSIPLDQAGVTPGSPGFNWALDLETFKTIMDGHHHTGGPLDGLQITPAAININADLGWGGNNLINLRSLRLANQGSPLSGANDLGCIYESGGNLYYNNSTGQQVQITTGNSLVASGGIGGIGGTTAALTYSNASKTFIFTQAANQSASLDAGQLILRDPATVSSAGITMKVPAGGPGSSYSLTWPGALPGTGDLYWVNSAGTISTGAFTSTNGGTFNGSVTLGLGATLPSLAQATAATPGAGGQTLYWDSVGVKLFAKNSAGNSSPFLMVAANTTSVTAISASGTEAIVAGGPSGSNGLGTQNNFKLPANGLVVGSLLRVHFVGLCTSSAGDTITLRVRIGTNGTTADGAVLTWSWTAAASGSTIPYYITITAPISAIGASATFGSGSTAEIATQGTTGIQAVSYNAPTTTTATFNSTASNFVEATLQSSSTHETITVQSGTIEWGLG